MRMATSLEFVSDWRKYEIKNDKMNDDKMNDDKVIILKCLCDNSCVPKCFQINKRSNNLCLKNVRLL